MSVNTSEGRSPTDVTTPQDDSTKPAANVSPTKEEETEKQDDVIVEANLVARSSSSVPSNPSSSSSSSSSGDRERLLEQTLEEMKKMRLDMLLMTQELIKSKEEQKIKAEEECKAKEAELKALKAKIQKEAKSKEVVVRKDVQHHHYVHVSGIPDIYIRNIRNIEYDNYHYLPRGVYHDDIDSVCDCYDSKKLITEML